MGQDRLITFPAFREHCLLHLVKVILANWSQMDMKIAVWHNLPSGGGKRALYYHIKGLVERGHTVEVWRPSTSEQDYLPLSNLVKENVVDLAQPSKRTNLAYRIGRFYWQLNDDISAMHLHSQQCANEIHQRDFDVLFANSCQFLHAPVIGQYIKIPKVLYLGEPYRPLYEARPRLVWAALPSQNLSVSYLKEILRDLVRIRRMRIRAREELKNAQAFDLILVNSLFSRESIIRAYGLDAAVCYLGVDTDLFKPLNLTRQNSVIGIGSLYYGKGIERAIRAIATINSQERPALVWVGNQTDESYRIQMEELATSLNVDFVYKYLVPDQELIELINQAAVMIYTPILEPFGLAPLEANACGTPVVALAEGGVRESIQNGVNGFLIPGNDSLAIGQAVKQLLSDRELLSQMSIQAREHILKIWSLKQAIDNLENALHLISA